MQIFYTPTRTNIAVVKKLKLIPVLQVHEFKPLECAEWRRKKQIEKIDGNAVFFWGDGTWHHESFYFTDPIRDKLKLKINVDMHGDWDPTKETTDANSWDHMRATENTGIRIVTPNWEGDVLRTISLAKAEGQAYEKGEIVLTIDLDGVRGIPAHCPQWISAFVPPVDEVIKLIKALGARITRVDIGGLYEDLDDFSIVNLPKWYVPSTYELNGVISGVYSENGGIITSPDAIQRLWDRVGTYVTYAIADLLDEFARAIGKGKEVKTCVGSGLSQYTT